MKRIATAVILALAGLLASGQAIPISNGPVINQYGQPQPFASIRVCSVTSTGSPCTPLVSVYLDYGLTIPSGNPFQADQYGNYTVYAPALAAPNMYMVQIIPQSGVTYSYVINGPACSLSGCTFTGNVTAPIFNATLAPYYEINGSQVTCTMLLDCANLAKLNAANVFTGSPQTAPVFNATTGYQVGGIALAAQNLSNGVTGSGLVVLATAPTLVTPNIGAATGLTLVLSSSLTTGGAASIGGSLSSLDMNSSLGYRVSGTAPINHILVGNGSYYVDSATLPPGSLPTIYYQTVLNGSLTAMTQRPNLQFGTGMTVTDNSTYTAIAAKVTTTNPTADAFLASAAGAGTSGHCAQWDANGGVGDSGGACASSGSGSTTTNGYYVSPFGVIFEWGAITAFDTGPTTITLPFAMPHALLNVSLTDCYDSTLCSGASTTSRIWEWGLPTTTNFSARNNGLGAATFMAIGW